MKKQTFGHILQKLNGKRKGETEKALRASVTRYIHNAKSLTLSLTVQ